MDQIYANHYSILYRHHWWWRARESYLVRVIRSIAPPSGFGPILDVGCGNALFFDTLQEFGTPEGVEVCEEIVTEVESAKGRIHIGKFGPEFQPNQTYGLILMLDVLEHLDDPMQALRCARALLKPDGRLMVTVPAFNLLWTSHDDYNQHLTRYRRPMIERMARNSGFNVLESRYFFHALFFAKLLTRAKEVVFSGQKEMASVPPQAVNRVAYRFFLAEEFVFSRFSPPFGSSLLSLFEPSRSTE